jgi:hypothetical protein
MRVKKIYDNLELVVVDLEVHLGTQIRNKPTLCAMVEKEGKKKLIPLNTPDGRPIFMDEANSIDLE